MWAVVWDNGIVGHVFRFCVCVLRMDMDRVCLYDEVHGPGVMIPLPC